MTCHQCVEHHVLGTPEPQFTSVQAVAPKPPQQPRINRVGLGLDTLNLAECLDAERMHHRPRHIRRRQRRLQLPLVAATALEHHDVARWIESSHQGRDRRGLIRMPLDFGRILACHVEPALADIDPNDPLAVHTDLHHVSRVRTEHSIVYGPPAPSTVRVPDRRDAGGPPDLHGRKDLPGPRGPAGTAFFRRRRQHTTRDRSTLRIRNDPGSAAHRSQALTLRCARETDPAAPAGARSSPRCRRRGCGRSPPRSARAQPPCRRRWRGGASPRRGRWRHGRSRK